MNQPMLQVEWEPCLLERGRDPALEAFVRREMGVSPPFLPYLLHCPWLVRALIIASFDHGNLVHLDLQLADLVALVVSHENSCRFCYAESRALLRFQGMSEARVQELEARLANTSLEPRAAAVVAFARRLARSTPLVGPTDKQQLFDEGFTREQVRELAFVVAYMVFANRVTTVPAIPPYGVEKMPDLWRFRLLRPLIARSLAAHRKTGHPEAGSPPYDGPYACIVRAFKGSPIASTLAQVLGEAWGSPHLTRRCKALMFAVVATGLGCDLSLHEVRGLLAEEGLEDATVERALHHLQSPDLDAVENEVLAFTRETLWYQPAAIQRRARAVRNRMTREQFLEALGIAALANALCRLGAAVVRE